MRVLEGGIGRGTLASTGNLQSHSHGAEELCLETWCHRGKGAEERVLRKRRTTKLFKTKFHSVLALLPPGTGKGEGDPQHQAVTAAEDPALSSNLQLQEVAGVSELEEIGKVPSGWPLSTDAVVY